MNILLFSLPGIPIPLSAVLLFIAAAAAFILIPNKLVAVLTMLAATACGIVIAFSTSSDMMLLSSLLFVLLAVCIVFLGIGGRSGRFDTDDGGRRNK